MPELPEKEGVFTPGVGISTYTASVRQYGKAVFLYVAMIENVAPGIRTIGTISGLDVEFTEQMIIPAIALTENGAYPTAAGIETNGDITVAVDQNLIGLSISGTVIVK